MSSPLRPALLLAALASLLPAAPAAAEECPLVDGAELTRLTELELGADASRLQLRCSGQHARLRIGALTRELDLASTPASARPRLLALAASELAIASREPIRAPLGTTRRNRSEAAMWKQLLATTLAVSFSAAPVFAAPVQKSEARVEAHPTALSRPAPQSREIPEPQLRAEDVFDPVGDKVRAVTDAQLTLLVALVDHTLDSDPEKPELLQRMGDLHVEKERYHRFRARTLDARIFEAQRAGRIAEVAKLRAAQAAEEKHEQDSTLDAVKVYLEIANGPYSGYKKMDEVLFDLGRLLREAKKEEASRGFWKRLIKDHPTSRYVPDGLLAFGDDAFERRDLEGALAFYEKVMAYANSPLAEYARYKTGWCFYNQSRFKESLETFVQVADHARHGRNAGRLALLKEALKDTVRAFAQVGAVERAWPFFVRVGGPSAPAMLEQLAEIENAQGKFLDAVRLYRQLMALAPQSPRLCGWQVEVVKNTLAQGGSRAEPEAVRELERLAAVNAREKDNECHDTTAALLREMAMVWHQEAQRTHQLPTYQRAGQLYAQYLKSFPKAADITTISFYYAELLYKLDRHCDAAPLYAEAVKGDPKHREEAALAQVLSWRACLKLDDKPPEASRKPNAPPRPIPESWRKMIEAFDFYLQYVKNGPDRVRVQYQKALAYYELDHCEEAIPLFGDLARHQQSSALAVYAADLLFDCRAQKADKVQLRADARELCAKPALTASRPDFARRCGVIQAALIRDEAESREAQHDYKGAADLYLQLVAEYPNYPGLDEVLYDAGVDYQRDNMVGLAILALQELIRLRPDSPLAKKAIYMIGRSYQNIAAFEAAAENYEKFAARWPGERDAATALYRAAFLRRGLGDPQRADADTRLYVQLFGARADLADSAAALAFDEGTLQKYLKEWGARGGVDRQVIAHVKLGELAWRASCPVAGVNGSCIERRRDRPKASDSCGGPVRIVVYPRKPELAREAEAHFATALKLFAEAKPPADSARAAEMAYYAAEARMRKADAELERFLALKLPLSQKRLAAWFAEKTSDLDRARSQYESVILMKQAHFAIAAAGRVGQMFQIFAAQLNSLPVPPAPPPPAGADPKTWKEDFKNAFCGQLAEHVNTLEDKAEDALKLCLDKSTSLSWFNEWSELCEAELNQLKPRSYPLAAELRAEPRFVSASPDRVPPQR